MAIPLPNPNINDFDTNDVQTWSSNKLKEGFEAVGGSVGSDGSIEPKNAKLISTITTEESATSVDVNIDNMTEIIVIATVTFTETITNNLFLSVKTPENPNSFISTPALCNRSFTANAPITCYLKIDCKNGLLKGLGCASASNSYGTVNVYNSTQSLANLLTTKFTALRVQSVNAMPAGTEIKVYGY